MELKSIQDNLKVVAAIPCFNTEQTIGNIVANAKKYVDEVIVVDDGSTDKTAEIAVLSGARVVAHETNRGYGVAVKTCFEAAKKTKVDILVIIDGDGQHNPDEIPSLLMPIIKGGADLVIGSRFIGSNIEPANSNIKQNIIPRYRKFGIGVINFLWNLGHATKVTDTQSGFRAYRKELFADLKLMENGMGISIEILEKMRKMNPIIREVSISCSYDSNNSHINFNAIKHGIAVAYSVLKVRMKYVFM